MKFLLFAVVCILVAVRAYPDPTGSYPPTQEPGTEDYESFSMFTTDPSFATESKSIGPSSLHNTVRWP